MDSQLKEGLPLACLRLERWLPLLIVVITLTGWEWLARAGRISSLFFPAPSVILLTLARLFMSGELATHVGATLSRVLFGFTLGGILGLILGLVMGWSRRFRAVIDPFVAAAHPVPKVALLPLIMLVFGIGESSKVIVIAMAAFFPMLINAMAGVQQISPVYFEVADNYGASPGKVFVRIVIPGSLPLILAGARVALNVALLLTIAVELVAAREGLGAMVWFAWQTLRTEELYASVAVTAALGFSFNYLLQRLVNSLVPWQLRPEL